DGRPRRRAEIRDSRITLRSMRATELHSARQELEYLLGIKRTCLGVDRLNGRREGRKLGSIELGDFATRGSDRGARLFVLRAGEVALEGDGRGDGFAHRVLQPRRPGIKGRAVKENRTRNVEVIGDAMEAVKLVHAVGYGVGERILLRVEG